MKKCKHCGKKLDFEIFCSPECAMLYKKVKDTEKRKDIKTSTTKPNINDGGCGCNK